MLLAPLPFDYATLVDTGDRVRKSRKRSDTRVVRRALAKSED
jgi:hypothetical protein